MKSFFAAAFCGITACHALSFQAPGEKPLAEALKIEKLIQAIETMKDASMIRNGTEYDAKTAARFLRGKWDSQGKDIRTAKEFIEKIASVSSTTGKPYQIRFKDGKSIPALEFFQRELEMLEKPPQKK